MIWGPSRAQIVPLLLGIGHLRQTVCLSAALVRLTLAKRSGPVSLPAIAGTATHVPLDFSPRMEYHKRQ